MADYCYSSQISKAVILLLPIRYSLYIETLPSKCRFIGKYLCVWERKMVIAFETFVRYSGNIDICCLK